MIDGLQGTDTKENLFTATITAEKREGKKLNLKDWTWSYVKKGIDRVRDVIQAVG